MTPKGTADTAAADITVAGAAATAPFSAGSSTDMIHAHEAGVANTGTPRLGHAA